MDGEITTRLPTEKKRQETATNRNTFLSLTVQNHENSLSLPIRTMCLGEQDKIALVVRCLKVILN